MASSSMGPADFRGVHSFPVVSDVEAYFFQTAA